MEKQTAVEWFAIQLYEQGYFDGSTPKSITNLDHLQEQTKQMEKEQIIDAFDEGQEYEYQYHVNNAPKFDSQTYYNETYGSKGSGIMTTENHIGVLSEAVKEITSSQSELATNCSQLEISDEEIEKAADKYVCEDEFNRLLECFQVGAKWYREQLKQRQ